MQEPGWIDSLGTNVLVLIIVELTCCFILDLIPTTVGSYVGGVILVPCVVSLLWFVTFGGTAIAEQQNGGNPYGNGSAEEITFNVLKELPWTASPRCW